MSTEPTVSQITDERSNVGGDTKKEEESAKDDDEQMLSHASMTSLGSP